MGATIRGDKELIKLLRDLKGRVKDMQPVWVQVGDVVADYMGRQFDSYGVALASGPWAPLSPNYLAWKISKGYDPRIWRMTGQSVQDLTGRPMKVETYSRHQATFGTDRPYQSFVHSGTKHMPARPMMNVTPAFAHDVNQTLKNYLLKAL